MNPYALIYLIGWGKFSAMIGLAVLILILINNAVKIIIEGDGDVTEALPKAEGKKSAGTPAAPLPQPKLPGDTLTPDRYVALTFVPASLTEQEARAIAQQVREWKFLQDAWNDADRLIRDTERGI